MNFSDYTVDELVEEQEEILAYYISLVEERSSPFSKEEMCELDKLTQECRDRYAAINVEIASRL